MPLSSEFCFLTIHFCKVYHIRYSLFICYFNDVCILLQISFLYQLHMLNDYIFMTAIIKRKYGQEKNFGSGQLIFENWSGGPVDVFFFEPQPNFFQI